MTDLSAAKNGLKGHTLCVCRAGETITSDKRGISPMMGLIAENVPLQGSSVADLIVGKAAALLFVKCGVSAVFAKTLSISGKTVLERNHIPYEYETLTERIVNREGTDVCPMEKTVEGCDDPEEGYRLLRARLEGMISEKA